MNISAEKSNSDAFLKIGMLYKNGDVVKKNYTKARENLKKRILVQLVDIWLTF